MLHDLDIGVNVRHPVGSRIEFLAPYVLRTVDHLAVQVGVVDDVKIDYADASDAGGREIQPERRAEAASAHQHHARVSSA